ncbi:unnamed protein product [Protopolystoma xenopodis]|uniref:Uncharacterized protein n=1 Tax=Protopolystoma xenopodis TaxID=117903 RepID=A0A3S5CRB9_9PLAT|nr:unnamed protein product [Protopolystoma xenopodis]
MLFFFFLLTDFRSNNAINQDGVSLTPPPFEFEAPNDFHLAESIEEPSSFLAEQASCPLLHDNQFYASSVTPMSLASCSSIFYLFISSQYNDVDVNNISPLILYI